MANAPGRMEVVLQQDIDLPSPFPTCSLSLSPSSSPTSQSDHLSHNAPTSMQASKRARKQALSTKKKPPTTALSIFGLLRQGLKRRAAFSAASKIIKTRCNNQSRRRGGSASRTGGGGEKKRNTLEMQVTAPLGRTCTYIHVYLRSTKIIPFYRLFLLFFFFFFFLLLSLCATFAKKMLLEHYRCAGVILGGV